MHRGAGEADVPFLVAADAYGIPDLPHTHLESVRDTRSPHLEFKGGLEYRCLEKKTLHYGAGWGGRWRLRHAVLSMVFSPSVPSCVQSFSMFAIPPSSCFLPVCVYACVRFFSFASSGRGVGVLPVRDLGCVRCSLGSSFPSGTYGHGAGFQDHGTTVPRRAITVNVRRGRGRARHMAYTQLSGATGDTGFPSANPHVNDTKVRSCFRPLAFLSPCPRPLYPRLHVRRI